MKNTRTPAGKMPHSFRVTLTKSDNEYLTYPCAGRIQIIETFLNGGILAVFQRGTYEGAQFFADGGPVGIKNPVFNYQ